MTEIPNDIMDSAESLNVNYVMPDPAEVRQAAAELILAERQRCLAIIDDVRLRSLKYSDQGTCMEISVLVRSGGEA